MLTLRPPAKINWFLNVFNRREDGFHDILSLMQQVSLSDILTFDDAGEIEVITEAAIPLNNNLVYRSALLLKEFSGVKLGARIELKKEVPMAAGLGGGSSDAAYTMIGLNRLWNLNLPVHELMRLGERLGSDIPFFFQGPVAVVEGRGEKVSPVTLMKPYTLLLVKPRIEVSTAWAYKEFHDSAESDSVVLTNKANNIKLLCHALENGDLSYLSSTLRNDLESHVVKRHPVINNIKNELLSKGAVFSSMSGSGPTVFGVFETEGKALNAMKGMPPDNWCRVVETVTSVE